MEEVFEAHYTISLSDHPELESLEQLRILGDNLGLKFSHIVLDRGLSMSQPMLTSHARGELSSQIQAAEKVAKELERHSFPVTRIKLEVSADSCLAPDNQSDSRLDSEEFYFEHHVKVQLPLDDPLDHLRELIAGRNAHLSRNAFKTLPQHQERFVTQRVFKRPRKIAGEQLSELIDVIKENEIKILEIEEEYVVYDSNYHLDAGWIT